VPARSVILLDAFLPHLKQSPWVRKALYDMALTQITARGAPLMMAGVTLSEESRKTSLR
jgi:hypothetical protein